MRQNVTRQYATFFLTQIYISIAILNKDEGKQNIMKQINKTHLALTAFMFAIPFTTSAHISVSTENVYALGDNAREYVEGSSATLALNLSHDCRGNATTDVTVIFPNGEGLSPADFYTKDRNETLYGANALMGIKAKNNALWEAVYVTKDAISPYYKYGIKDTDTRAIQWLGGYIDNNHYDRLEFSATFPSIKEDSCVKSLKVELPTIQFCENNTLIAWIGSLDTSFAVSDDNRIEEFYEPSINIVRHKNNPLPEACGEGENVVIKPSIDEMNQYLPIDEDAKAVLNNKVVEANTSTDHPDNNAASLGLYGLFGLSLLAVLRLVSRQQ